MSFCQCWRDILKYLQKCEGCYSLLWYTVYIYIYMIRNNLDTYNYFFLNFDRCTNLISMMEVEEQPCPTKQNDLFETNVKILIKSGHLKDSKDQISSTWNGCPTQHYSWLNFCCYHFVLSSHWLHKWYLILNIQNKIICHECQACFYLFIFYIQIKFPVFLCWKILSYV